MSLGGKVCLVTGATRGIGKGIAAMLAKAGATVYITGRTVNEELQNEISMYGGNCVSVQCDHGNDEQVKQLFEKIKDEQNGKLDILVNNAYAGVTAIIDNMGTKFYEQPLTMWDSINNVGLRSNYVAAHFAANMMIPNKQGLIVNISSAGGLRYLFNVPYGIGKAANDRMMADMAIELRKHNIAAISLWPGPARTETINDLLGGEKGEVAAKNGATLTYNTKDAIGPGAGFSKSLSMMQSTTVAITAIYGNQAKANGILFLVSISVENRHGYADFFRFFDGTPFSEIAAKLFGNKNSEDPTFAGKAIVALANDKNIIKKSGCILLTAELAREYGFTDIGGNLPLSIRQVKYLMGLRYPKLEWLVPEFIYIPWWMIAAQTHSFCSNHSSQTSPASKL